MYVLLVILFEREKWGLLGLSYVYKVVRVLRSRIKFWYLIYKVNVFLLKKIILFKI